MSDIQGLEQLQARLRAINPKALSRGLLPALGLATVQEAKLTVPKRTGNLARTIHMAAASQTSVRVVASARYAAYVERGTGPHPIFPRTKKVLAWPAAGAKTRLTGSLSKSEYSGGKPRRGALVFSRHVQHPGTRPHPFLLPAAEKVVSGAGVATLVIEAWNKGA